MAGRGNRPVRRAWVSRPRDARASEVHRLLPRTSLPVETRLQPLDRAQLAHGRLDRSRAHAVVDACRLSEKLQHGRALLRVENIQ